MGGAIGSLTANGLAAAITPFAMIAVISLLASANNRGRARLFAAGWSLGFAAALAVFVLLFVAIGVHRKGEPAAWVPWFKLLFGLLIVAFATPEIRGALRVIRGHGDTDVPEWISRIDALGPGMLLRTGAQQALAPPKNLMQVILAALAIASLAPHTGDRIVSGLVFVVLASTVTVVPLLLFRLHGDRMTADLADLKIWVVGNNHVIMAILFILLGAKSFGEGLALLT